MRSIGRFAGFIAVLSTCVLYYNVSVGHLDLPMGIVLLPLIVFVILAVMWSMFRGFINILGRMIRSFTHWIY